MLSLQFGVMEKMFLDLCFRCIFGLWKKWFWIYAVFALLGSWKNICGVMLSLHFWGHGKMFLELYFRCTFGLMEKCFWIYVLITLLGSWNNVFGFMLSLQFGVMDKCCCWVPETQSRNDKTSWCWHHDVSATPKKHHLANDVLSSGQTPVLGAGLGPKMIKHHLPDDVLSS